MEISVARLFAIPTQRVKVQPQLRPAAYFEIAGFTIAIPHPLGLRLFLGLLVPLSPSPLVRLTPVLFVPGNTALVTELRLYNSRVQ